MSEHEVNAINKPNRDSIHEYITHIGNNNYPKWRITREDAIRRIESNSDSFYVADPITRKKAYIGVVREGMKYPYLRTYSDNTWNNNLLSLQEFTTL
ncbi:MAG: hypothetical protein ACJAZX_001594 [Rickettsiales bacterium]|jgi:hypothetical protein